MAQAEALMTGVDMVVATPGRLICVVEAQILTLKSVTFLVLDEADRMLDLGFEAQVRALASQLHPERQTLMYGATWGHDIQCLAESFMEDPVKVVADAADVLPGSSTV